MIEKKLSPKGRSVRVTFQLPAEAAENSVAVVGDFNDWDKEKDLMKRDGKKGVWTKSISLKPDSTYQFRYYIDDREWRNDEQADRYVANEYFSENSVLDL